MYKDLFAMQCGKDCLLVKKRIDLYVIGRKISIHMSQKTRKKKRKVSVPGNFNVDRIHGEVLRSGWTIGKRAHEISGTRNCLRENVNSY